jgi:hypothetical protein
MHACARCVLRPQPTCRMYVHGRDRAQPAGTHLGLRLRLNQRFGLQPPRPTGVVAKPNSQCVASYVPVSATCATPPSQWAAMRYVRARPSVVRQQRPIARSATRTSRRGCVGVGRRARSVQCGVRDVTWRHGAQAEVGARVSAGGRTSATAASYAASSLLCCAHWRGVFLRRFGPIRCAPRPRRSGKHSVTLACS